MIYNILLPWPIRDSDKSTFVDRVKSAIHTARFKDSVDKKYRLTWDLYPPYCNIIYKRQDLIDFSKIRSEIISHVFSDVSIFKIMCESVENNCYKNSARLIGVHLKIEEID